MLGVGNLYLCALSVSFTINSGLSGEKPFEELHFKQSVFIASILLSLRTTARLGKIWLSKLTFVSPK